MAYKLDYTPIILKNPGIINLTSSGAHELFKLGDNSFIWTDIEIYMELAQGVSDDPTFSIGFNSPNYDNLVTSTNYTTFGETGLFVLKQTPVDTLTQAIPGSTSIYINVTTAAIASFYNVQILLIGNYQYDSVQ